MPKLLTGMAIGLNGLTGLEFSPHHPFAACRICGAIYQHEDDRTKQWTYGHKRRHDLWRFRHTRLKHTTKEVNDFKLSGRALTPEAATKLAPFGVIPISDLIDEEVTHALMEAPRAPVNDAER